MRQRKVRPLNETEVSVIEGEAESAGLKNPRVVPELSSARILCGCQVAGSSSPAGFQVVLEADGPLLREGSELLTQEASLKWESIKKCVWQRLYLSIQGCGMCGYKKVDTLKLVERTAGSPSSSPTR